ncbi:hypothetical protein HDV02_003310 [Globomyces sp. JEL0801]|nr:hypothetical protein HDV02_003310 [Globomyces sp. JEL0801]
MNNVNVFSTFFSAVFSIPSVTIPCLFTLNRYYQAAQNCQPLFPLGRPRSKIPVPSRKLLKSNKAVKISAIKPSHLVVKLPLQSKIPVARSKRAPLYPKLSMNHIETQTDDTSSEAKPSKVSIMNVKKLLALKQENDSSHQEGQSSLQIMYFFKVGNCSESYTSQLTEADESHHNLQPQELLKLQLTWLNKLNSQFTKLLVEEATENEHTVVNFDESVDPNAIRDVKSDASTNCSQDTNMLPATDSLRKEVPTETTKTDWSNYVPPMIPAFKKAPSPLLTYNSSTFGPEDKPPKYNERPMAPVEVPEEVAWKRTVSDDLSLTDKSAPVYTGRTRYRHQTLTNC